MREILPGYTTDRKIVSAIYKELSKLIKKTTQLTWWPKQLAVQV